MELCGPTAFDHFGPSGQPVGRSHPAPWIQVAAVSRDQTKNTFTLFPTMISAQLREDYGLDIHKEIIHKANGGRIEAVTSSPKSLEGGRAHFVMMNETQFWMENNNGHEMSDAIAGNTAKGRAESPFRRLAICNAHRPGENSVAEQDYEFFEKMMGGTTKATKFLYDAREARPDTVIQDEGSLRQGIIDARGDSVWLDVDRLMEEIWDPRTLPSEARRKYLNQIVASEDAWITKDTWEGLKKSGMRLRPGDRITLGFDGSRGNDHTALCACRVEDGALFLLNVWNPKTMPGGKVPGTQVDAAVRSAFSTFDVVSFRADVKEFEAYIDQWTTDFGRKLPVKASPGNPIAYDMRSKGKREFPLDCEAFANAVQDKAISHDGNRVLQQHIVNARVRPNNDGVIGIGKESRDSQRKIDAAVTAVLAFAARQEFLKSKSNRSREVGIF